VSECWIWQGRTNLKGYGVCYYRGRNYGAHRLAAHVWLGLDLSRSDLQVCHHCDNPPCVNPDHLFIGTAKDNHEDRMKKGGEIKGYPGSREHHDGATSV